MLFQDTLKTPNLFVTESKIVAHAGGTFKFHLIEYVVGERIEALSRGICRAGKVGIAFSLRDIFGTGEGQRRHFCLSQVIDRREQFERGKRSEHDVDLVALDNFLCLIFRTRRIAARALDNQIDPSPRQREIRIVEKRADALLEMNAAGGKRAGFYSEQADLEWRILCDRRHRKCGDSSRGTGEKLAAIGPVGHGILPGASAVLAQPDIWT